MATEPERPIEKLLAAAAKKRRDELEKPLELHPADRRLLQGEVARKYAAANRAERDSSQGRTVWWPKLAWLLGTVTVLGVALVLIVPTAHKQNFGTVGSLAKLERGPASPAVDAPAATRQSPPAASPPAPSQPAAAPGGTLTEVAQAETGRAASGGAQVWADKQAAEPGTARAVAETLSMKSKNEEVSSTVASRAPSAAFGNSIDAKDAGAGRSPYGLAGGAPALNFRSADLGTATMTNSLVALGTNSLAAVDSMAKAAPSSPARTFSGDHTYSLKAPTPAANAPATVVAGEAEAVRRSLALDSKAKSQVAVVQNFSQTMQNQKAKLVNHSTTPSPVLNSFDMEQIGHELRVTDKDGSEYIGFVQLADEPAGQNLQNNLSDARAVAREQIPAQANRSRKVQLNNAQNTGLSQNVQNAAMSQNYFFRVIGTNKSLKQQVVFSGNVVTVTNFPAMDQVTNAQGLGGFQLAPGETPALPLLNSRISGKAVVGDGQEIEIEAVPTKK